MIRLNSCNILYVIGVVKSQLKNRSDAHKSSTNTSSFLFAIGTLLISIPSAFANDLDHVGEDSLQATQDDGSAPETPSKTSLKLALTNFLTFQASGDGDTDPKFNGKVDAYAVVDGRDIGLWNGLTINLHPEVFYGRSFNGAGIGTSSRPGEARGAPVWLLALPRAKLCAIEPPGGIGGNETGGSQAFWRGHLAGRKCDRDGIFQVQQ